MKAEEAIRRIQDHMKVHHIGDGRHIHIKEALDMAIYALREQEERRWIPVTERLPEESGYYIVYYSNTASNKPLISMRHFYVETPAAFLHNKAMTYWMPLPEPPKEEGT